MYWRSFKPSLCASLYDWVKLWQWVLTTPQSGSESEPQSRAHEGGEQRRAEESSTVDWVTCGFYGSMGGEMTRQPSVYTGCITQTSDWLTDWDLSFLLVCKACILWNWRVSVKLNVLWWVLHWYHSAFHVLIVNWHGMYNVLFQEIPIENIFGKSHFDQFITISMMAIRLSW